ncbi:DUF5362 domain-containing protein, partial [Candidatus Caldipriscus sp.]|nr:DUF5362 domain-containing protein [Candidatus Caldipriscus sp.]
YIKGTGWVKFIAVMSIGSGALSIPIGILVIILGIYLWGNREIANILGAFLSIVGVIVIPIGISTIIAGIKLWRGAKNLENYKNTEKEEDLKEALKNLLSYFTWYGRVDVLGLAILAIVLILLLRIGIHSMSGLK